MKTLLLTLNPLNFKGPVFLLFYAILAVAVWMFLKLFVTRKIDKDFSEAYPPTGETDDPYELAYLRGGVTEVIKLAAYRIIKMRIFTSRISGDKKILRLDKKKNHPDFMYCEPENIILKKCTSNVNYLEDIIRNEYVKNNIDLHCKIIHNKLRDKNLQWDEESISKLTVWKIGVILFLISVALSKTLYAIGNGHQNVTFLVLLTIIFSALIYKHIEPPITSKAGQELLDRMKIKYHTDSLRIKNIPDDLELLLVSLFGLTILEGTPLEFMDEFTSAHLNGWFNWDISQWDYSVGTGYGSSSSGGCSGGSCGGGGCGGGCGGCG